MRTRLAEAAAEGTPVRVKRWMAGTTALDGFVVGVGRSWALLHLLDGPALLDGHAALRIEDVRRVRPRPHAEFVRRALAAGGGQPGPLELPLDRTADLVRAAGEAYPLVALREEYTDPGTFFVGAVTGQRRKRLQLSEIRPSARWAAEPTWWSFRRLSRIDVGGRYERALWHVATDADQAHVPAAWSGGAH